MMMNFNSSTIAFTGELLLVADSFCLSVCAQRSRWNSVSKSSWELKSKRTAPLKSAASPSANSFNPAVAEVAVEVIGTDESWRGGRGF